MLQVLQSVIQNVMNAADVWDAVKANVTGTVSEDTDLTPKRTRA